MTTDDARRTALITGAGRGIGAATARELGRRGFHVIVNYRTNAAAAAEVTAAIEDAGGTARSVRADVLVPDDVSELVAEALRETGRIDVLVCNAATVAPRFGPLSSVTWEEFHGKVGGELSGVFHVTQRVLPGMVARRSGRIVYLSSVSAEQLDGSVPHSVAKSALNAFSLRVAVEAGRSGVVVHTVAPGLVTTDASAPFVTAPLLKHVAGSSVLGRATGPEDVARVIGALSDGGFDVATGSLIRLDGGVSILEVAPSRIAAAQEQAGEFGVVDRGEGGVVGRQGPDAAGG